MRKATDRNEVTGRVIIYVIANLLCMKLLCFFTDIHYRTYGTYFLDGQ